MLGVSAKALQEKNQVEMGDFQGVGQFGPIFQIKEDISTNHSSYHMA